MPKLNSHKLRAKWDNWINVGFWGAMVLIYWDWYQTVLAANDTPWRLHHFYYGYFAVMIFWITSHWKFYFLGIRRLLRR